MLLALALCLQDPAALLADLERALAQGPREIEATLSRTQVLTWESFLAEGTIITDPGRDAFRVDARVRELRTEASRTVTYWHEDARWVFLDHDARTFAVSSTSAGWPAAWRSISGA